MPADLNAAWLIVKEPAVQKLFFALAWYRSAGLRRVLLQWESQKAGLRCLFGGLPSTISQNGSAGADKKFPEGGLVAANIKATSYAEMLGAVYTSPYGILDGKFAAGVIIPYLWVDVRGSVTGPLGKTLTRSDFANGIGDIILVPFWLNWTCGDFKWAVQLDVYAPTGAYNTGQLANVGLNYWTFEPFRLAL